MRLSMEKSLLEQMTIEQFRQNLALLKAEEIEMPKKWVLELLNTIEALQQENEQLQAQVAKMREALRKAREALDYWRELYGIGLEVLNWHMNGDIETFDSFYDSSGTYEALAEIDKAIGGGKK